MLQTKIKTDMMAAWKAKEPLVKDTLSFILSRIKNRAIELKVEKLSDGEVLLLIQKFIKELQDERDGYLKVNNTFAFGKASEQIGIISSYLPKQLTEDEIKAEIEKLNDKSVPSVMKHFKANFAGQVDMSMVSRIARG